MQPLSANGIEGTPQFPEAALERHGDIHTAESSCASAGASSEAPDTSVRPADATPREHDESLTELVFDLVCEWYGAGVPAMKSIRSISSDTFAKLWTTLWFAKGELQRTVDAHLQRYGPLLAAPHDAWKSPPARFSAEHVLLWRLGWMLAWDQVSRNIFRGTARAYATDSAAREIAEVLHSEAAAVPLPVRVSIALVYIHSEDLSDLAYLHDVMLPAMEPEMRGAHPDVWRSLVGIATNHRDRMRAFGRIPERNAFLGRESTSEELAWMAAIRGFV